jgi:hypothetical protein
VPLILDKFLQKIYLFLKSGFSSLVSLTTTATFTTGIMVSFIYGSGEPNLHFHEIVSPKLNVTDLVTELREFELPTDGLKADLQARLQLAYLGVLAPEHEEEIAGWFGLNKAGLDKKCKELGVVSGPAKASMQANRRAAVMKFCESHFSNLCAGNLRLMMRN